MLPRLPIFVGLACFALLSVLGGCSSSKRKDQNYGTNAGSDYQIPDAATFSSQGDADVDDALEDSDGDGPWDSGSDSAAERPEDSGSDVAADETRDSGADSAVDGSPESGADIDS
jgi:hypothetical protein